MKIPRRLRRVKFEAAAHHTTSFAGLRFVFDLAVKLGVVHDLRTLTVKQRRRGIPIEDFVMGLAANFVIGGDSLTDLQVLRDEAVTRQLCYDLEVPAPTTAGERLRTFSRGHLAQLEAINRRAARAVLEGIGGSAPTTVDLDSSIFDVYGPAAHGLKEVPFLRLQSPGRHRILCPCPREADIMSRSLEGAPLPVRPAIPSSGRVRRRRAIP